MPKLKERAAKRSLSAFVNQCLREHFEQEERAKREHALEAAYARAGAETCHDIEADFDAGDIEDWPEW